MSCFDEKLSWVAHVSGSSIIHYEHLYIFTKLTRIFGWVNAAISPSSNSICQRYKILCYRGCIFTAFVAFCLMRVHTYADFKSIECDCFWGKFSFCHVDKKISCHRSDMGVFWKKLATQIYRRLCNTLIIVVRISQIINILINAV